MGTTRAGLVLACILLFGCQRPPASPSVAYQIVDEGQFGGDCRACVVPTGANGVCRDEGQPAELRWQVPGSDPEDSVRVVIERSDGVRVDVAVGPSSGRAPLPQQVKSGDRIVVLAAESGQELMFSRIRASLGCPLQADQGGGTTSAGPG